MTVTKKIFAIVATATAAILLSVGLGSDFFKAALFGGGTETGIIAEQVYIPNDFYGAPGQSGEIILKSNIETQNTTGFSFQLSWDPNKATYLDASDTGTVFQNKNFTLQKNVDSIAGNLNVTLVASDAGVNLKKDDVLLKIGFGIHQNLTAGDVIALNLSA